MKHLTELPLRIVVYADRNEKWIKRRFTIEQKRWSTIKKILEKEEKATFGKKGIISWIKNEIP